MYNNEKEKLEKQGNQNIENIVETETSTEVDIFTKKFGYDETFVERMLSAECKWSEKKEAFDNLTKITDQSKNKAIKNTDRTYFIVMVKKLLKQPNINVIHSIINALNNLSIGLNSNFFEAKDLFPYIITFLKEKKEGIINSLITCLCNFSLFINDNIVNEKLINYCTEKKLCNIAKINLCSLIENLIDKKSNIQLNYYTPIIIKIGKYLDDPNPEVRDKSIKLMGFINFKKKEIFKSIINSINLDERKKKKIEEYKNFYNNISHNNTNTKCVNLSNKKSENKINNNINQKKFGQKLIDKEKSKNISANDNKIKNIENKNNLNKALMKLFSKDNKINNSDNNDLILMNENYIDNKEKEIIAYVEEKIGNKNNLFINILKQGERREMFTYLNNFFLDINNNEEINNSYDYYFKFILINNNFFNENNCFILKESIKCINTLIERASNFSRKYFKIIIPLLVNKLDEKKVITDISNIIEKLSLKISQDEVISILISSLKDKPINIINEGIEIIKNTINKSKSLDCNKIIDKNHSKYSQISSTYNDNNNILGSYNRKNFDKIQLSRSPLLSTKKNISKYNYNVVDVLPLKQSELDNYIKNLSSNNITNKNISLIEIKKILIHSIEKNNININQIKDILVAFNNLLASITINIRANDSNIDNNEITLLRYLLDDYIFIANGKSLIENIEEIDIIYNSYETLLLLLSTKKLKSLNYGVDILSIVNTIILCLLTNFSKTLTIKTLIKIILDSSRKKDSLICSLSIKCLDKFRKILPEIQNIIDNNSIFVSLYEFFIDFQRTNKNLEINNNNENEKNSLLIINSIISEYINIYNNSIWYIYHKALDNNMIKLDIYFKRTIEILLKENNSKQIIESIKNNKENETIQDIMIYINKLKSNGEKISPEEKNNIYCEIVNLLRLNKINISILSNKIDGDIFSKIFELYYGINGSKQTQELSEDIVSQSQTNKNVSKKKNKTKNKPSLSPFKKTDKNKNENKSKNEKKSKNNINKTNITQQKKVKEISEQSKRIIEYKNKIKYLTESNKNRNQKKIEKENDENKQMNNNTNNNTNINTNKLVENTIKKIDKITLKSEDEDNNKTTNCGDSTFDEIINMKKKLEEIRKKIN